MGKGFPRDGSKVMNDEYFNVILQGDTVTCPLTMAEERETGNRCQIHQLANEIILSGSSFGIVKKYRRDTK
ncbi:hypothetical protein GCM10010978_06180 [Compostibacillus humi]|uniref:Uncharacterized protein n=1 Tax=Compostibacillus humi TaxID=1245525 RepID=A0A8J2ZPE9_9BACI|nr:hypothetical protein [Compostibacillus humi]GGH70840.1 hypothetical protein GCM10010978_06180 [Compostibacillus humi]